MKFKSTAEILIYGTLTINLSFWQQITFRAQTFKVQNQLKIYIFSFKMQNPMVDAAYYDPYQASGMAASVDDTGKNTIIFFQ